MELHELQQAFEDFCDEEECMAGEYWDQDGEHSDRWIEEHVPAEQEEEFRRLVGYW